METNNQQVQELVERLSRVELDLGRQIDDLKARVKVLEGTSAGKPASASEKEEGKEDVAVDVNNETTAELKNDSEEDGDELYDLGPNVWHSSLVIWSEIQGVGGSIMVALAFFINLISVLAFGAVVWFASGSFINNTIPSPESMLVFREGTAHLLSRANSIRELSLAARICAVDYSLSEGSTQMDVVSMDVAYNDQIGNMSIGVILSCLCITIWYLNTAPDLLDSVYFLQAILFLPRGRHTVFSVSDGGMPVLSQICYTRLLMATATGIVRLATLLVILLIGSIWLAQTWSMENLILNSAALTCIKIDGFLFDLLAPTTTKTQLDRLEPLRRPKLCKSNKLLSSIDKRSLSVLFGGVALVFWCLFTRILPLSNDIHTAANNLCGGDRDFVVSSDATGSYAWAPSKAFDSDGADSMAGFGMSVVRQLIDQQANCSAPIQGHAYALCDSSGTVTGFQMLSIYEGVGLEQVAQEHQLYCESDLMHIVPESFLASLGRKLGVELTRASSCGSLEQYCNDPDKPVLRMTCPNTCGCHEPSTGLVARSGCPPSCILQPAYTAARRSYSCTDDLSLAGFLGDSAFRRTIDGYRRQFPNLQHAAQLEQ